MNNHIHTLEDYYHSRLQNGLSSSQQLGWEDAEAHYARFKAFTAAVNIKQQSILDVGSGLGDLWVHLKQQNFDGSYTGVDVLPAMIERSRQRFPELRFILADVISQPESLHEQFDIVFSAGVFNLAEPAQEGFLARGFDSFTKLARSSIVISLLSTASPAQESNYHYFDPQQIVGCLSRPGWNLRVLAGYLDNDFLLIAERNGGTR